MDVGSEASMQAIPCDLSSTISTGSFLTTETLDVSPVDTGKCFIVLINGKLYHLQTFEVDLEVMI